ncbi:hypothetical protein EVG20_g9490 [Dentipellis fragilis]|uniref:O-methyltransferase C-terminal domain-containing protein n=1 Tax=Dentipellis fragilis TaxID=205917 RepID=A0A4Y9Y0Q5_9AGAM|nr:hypothetical protein EVG20_g9490 [Dentipellis fragilis]
MSDTDTNFQNQRRTDITSLIRLISSAANDAMHSWEQETGGIPSLDDSVPDSARAVSSPDLLRAVRLLEGACGQLCAALSPTFISVVNRAWAPLDAACLRVAVDAKIPDVLEGHPHGLHVSAIAKQTALPAEKLARTLRVLSMKHCFREVAKDTFANNRLSHALRSQLPLTDLVWTFENICNPPAWTHLSETLADSAYGPSDDLAKSAFSWGVREKMPDTPLFKYLATRPEESERFGKAMTAWQLGGVQEFYPIADLPENTTWCDIGGGMGGVLIPVANRNPQLRLTLQDQPHVVEEAKNNFAKECPDALKENRVSFVPINFFTESPVPNQDIYYMRMIIHDWPDAASVDILTNVRKAMKPSSRLLVRAYSSSTQYFSSRSKILHAVASTDDYVLISSVAASEGALETRGDVAPSPLLPNYGTGGARPFYMDVNMMCMLNAKERSLDDMIELGTKAGLVFVKFWDCVEMSIVEFKAANALGAQQPQSTQQVLSHGAHLWGVSQRPTRAPAYLLRKLANPRRKLTHHTAGSLCPTGAPLDAETLDPAQRKDGVHTLLKLIASSANDAVALWEQEAGSIPSLDEAKPDSTCASHPDLLRSVRILEGACFQLCSTLSPTFITLFMKGFAPLDAACLRVAVEAKIPGILENNPGGLRVAEIAMKTGLPANKLSRVLRVLSLKHCFREGQFVFFYAALPPALTRPMTVSKDTFANNRLSIALHSSAPLADLIHFFDSVCTPLAWNNLYDALMDPANGPSEEPTVCAFSWGAKDTVFGHLQKHRFGRAMTAIQLGAVHDFYPIGSLPPNATWCDVGGGVGGVLLPIAQAYPHLRLTLQDQPHVIEEGKKHFEQTCPAALQDNRISFVPLDFFKESPVPEQDIYYMRMIVHDWPDAACIQFLTNIRRVMKPTSRLLIQEYVLTDSVTESTSRTDKAGPNLPGVVDAPKPLLRNYGAGGIRPFLMDLNMMTLNNARERSLEDIIHLGHSAGLEFVKFWDCVEMSIVELKAA